MEQSPSAARHLGYAWLGKSVVVGCRILSEEFGNSNHGKKTEPMIFDPLTGKGYGGEASGAIPILFLLPQPGYLAVSPIDEDFIRDSLQAAVKIAGANRCHLEIMMKDNLTLAHHPENAIHWCQIAREVVSSM